MDGTAIGRTDGSSLGWLHELLAGEYDDDMHGLNSALSDGLTLGVRDCVELGEVDGSVDGHISSASTPLPRPLPTSYNAFKDGILSSPKCTISGGM